MSMVANDRSQTEMDAALTAEIAEAVSAATGTPVEDLPPLYEVIDPDALGALFSNRRTDGYVEFRYADRVVAVHADRTVEVSHGR